MVIFWYITHLTENDNDVTTHFYSIMNIIYYCIITAYINIYYYYIIRTRVESLYIIIIIIPTSYHYIRRRYLPRYIMWYCIILYTSHNMLPLACGRCCRCSTRGGRGEGGVIYYGFGIIIYFSSGFRSVSLALARVSLAVSSFLLFSSRAPEASVGVRYNNIIYLLRRVGGR